MKKKLRKYIILPLLAVLWICGCGKKEETDKAETVPDTAAETESQTEETEEKEQERTQYPVSEADTETIYAVSYTHLALFAPFSSPFPR